MPTSLLFNLILATVLAAGVALTATPWVKRLAVSAGVVREPRSRDAHAQPTPLWGGLGMFAGFMIAVLAMRLLTNQPLTVRTTAGLAGLASTAHRAGLGQHPVLGILVGASLIALVGLLDDKYDLKPKWQAGSILRVR